MVTDSTGRDAESAPTATPIFGSAPTSSTVTAGMAHQLSFSQAVTPPMIVVPEPSVHRTLVVLATFPEMMDGAGIQARPGNVSTPMGEPLRFREQGKSGDSR